MRVLMVSSHGDDQSAGGAERLIADLSAQLVARGTEVDYLQAFPLRGADDGFDRTVLYRSDWRDDRTRRVENRLGDLIAHPSDRLERAVALHRPDVVHTHNLPGITTAVWEVCRRLALPVVHSLHDYYLFCPRVTLTRRDGAPCQPSPLLCGLRTRRLARWAGAVSHVIGVSQYVLDLHAPLFRGAEHHLVRHPMPVTPAARMRPPRARPELVGYIGALDRTKGVHLLLDAAGHLAELGLGLRLAGDGRLREEVVAAARRHANVEWVGLVSGEGKTRFFEECDLGVVPSVWAEPGGPTFTMIEWLASGRPVLVSTRGGLGEVAGEYPGSIRVEPTEDAIVRAVEGLVDPVRWSHAVASSVRPTMSQQQPQAWVARHEAIYTAALALSPNKSRPAVQVRTEIGPSEG